MCGWGATRRFLGHVGRVEEGFRTRQRRRREEECVMIVDDTTN